VKTLPFRSVAFAVALIATTSSAAPQKFESELEIGNQKVQIFIATSAFDYTAHRFQRAQDGQILVDGVPAVGIDSCDPKTHVSDFRVSWNGRMIVVPKRLFQFVFNASLQPKPSSFDSTGSVFVRPGATGGSILIHISGGDAAGPFNSWWVISKDGHVDRFVDGPP
jgi:hypothetical protein